MKKLIPLLALLTALVLPAAALGETIVTSFFPIYIFARNLTQGIDGLENVFGEGETAKNNIAELATALSGNGISGSKAAAWNKLIDALLKADSINGLTGDELNNVKTELSDIKEAASGLT